MDTATDTHTITEYRTDYEWLAEVDGVQEADEPIRTEVGEWEHNLTPDEFDRAEGLTAVDLAHNLLRNAGVFEASSSPDWHPGTWYIAHYTHPYTGVIEETTFHLTRFTEEEARELYARITGKS